MAAILTASHDAGPEGFATMLARLTDLTFAVRGDLLAKPVDGKLLRVNELEYTAVFQAWSEDTEEFDGPVFVVNLTAPNLVLTYH